MNNIYIIHFGMGQKAMKAYECPLPQLFATTHHLSLYTYTSGYFANTKKSSRKNWLIL